MTNKPKTLRKHLSKRNVIIGAFILLVTLGIIAYMLIADHQKKQSGGTGETKAEPIKIQTSEEIASEIDKAGDESEKARLQLELASSKQREGDAQGALDAAQASISLKESHLAYAAAGAAYAALGSNDKAIEMYRKALSLTEKVDDPNKVSFYNDYRLEIKALGGEI